MGPMGLKWKKIISLSTRDKIRAPTDEGADPRHHTGQTEL
jgi:hypothetical protein